MVQPPAIRFCPPEPVTHSRQTIPGATPMTRTFRLVPHAAGAYATVALASATSLRAETVFHADAPGPGGGTAWSAVMSPAVTPPPAPRTTPPAVAARASH